jgi:hypothetical protein
VTDDIVFTPSVRRAQQARGSHAAESRRARSGWRVEIDDDLRAFIAERDSFYFGTASAAGRPYIQHRGGPKGFLKPLGPTTLGFADFAGNRQYITIGNLAENDQAHIFLMDYPGRQRVKLWGRARVVEGDADLLGRLSDPGYPGKPQRAILFEIEAWDINCRQHIRPRYDEGQLRALVVGLTERIAGLEAELARLRPAQALPA